MKFNINDKTIHEKKILIVEDDIVSLKIIKTILEHNGFTSIFIASNGKEAIDIIKKESIFLVLMNYKMPEMDGLEACKYINDNLNIPDSSIVIITSKNNDFTVRSSFDAGAIDFISKPIKPLELISRVENIIKMKLSLEMKNEKVNKLEKMNENLKEVMFHKTKQ